jgi:nicotinate-nucleotide pyrophosphorylase (carboxylating)
MDRRRRTPGVPGDRERARASRFPRDLPGLAPSALRVQLASFLREDRSDRDVTSRAVVPAGLRVRGTVEAQAVGVLSGSRVAATLCRMEHLRVLRAVGDGRSVRRGTAVLEVEGNARKLFAVERTLLNLLMHLSGVATETARAVRQARTGSTTLVVAATRKTLPGLRDLEKAAVVDGGGDPHRRDLSSAILVKSNHLALVDLPEAVRRALRSSQGRTRVLVEVSSPRAALAAARSGVTRLLVDNASPSQVRRVIDALDRAGLREHVVVEVSGGITARNIGAYARTGADVASLGSLTHSAAALPFHLKVRPITG